MTSPLSSALPSPTVPDAQQAPPRCNLHDIDMEFWAGDLAASAGGGSIRGWHCHKCGQEAIERNAAAAHERNDAERAKGLAAVKQAELEKRIGQSCIPARYRDFSFDTFPGRTERAKAQCATLRSYANRWFAMKRQGISVLLVGGAGTGKTGLACSVGNHVIREFHGSALFLSAYGAVRHMRDTWGRRGRTEREALDDLVNPDLLILDEVGTNVGTDSETAALFEVLNGRYAERKPTFLLANLPMDDYEAAGVARPGLRTYLGPRVIDRFRDDGSFTLAFDWPSLRGGGS